MIIEKYNNVKFELKYTIYNKIQADIHMGRVVDEARANGLTDYIFNEYLRGVLEEPKVDKLLTKIIRKRMKKACKMIYREIQSGRYDAKPGPEYKKYIVDNKEEVWAKPGDIIQVDDPSIPIIVKNLEEVKPENGESRTV